MSEAGNSDGGAREWIRSAIAHGYLHTGMPTVARPFRERYSVSIAAGAGWPKIRKRTGPTARILNYHRVNNDNDPFFPAASTAVFDAQMRFVARHYRVVSLEQAVKHLSGDSPTHVVAVTFDDGYRDNYENALSILQRYGIPATIFLTTGSLDSGEPLWFERISLCLKRTVRQRLELPVDPPLVFPLRTVAERVECNNRIQEFLRELTDSERGRWVDEIVSRLGEGGRERHRKMLTWDQVRHMKARGIDFGGHTLTHPFLSRTSEADAAREISGCKSRIEEEIRDTVGYFAYPNGHEADISPSVCELVRRAGYRGAVTTTWGPNDARTDRMQLRRGGPWETNRAMFAYKFDWYQLTNE